MTKRLGTSAGLTVAGASSPAIAKGAVSVLANSAVWLASVSTEKEEMVCGLPLSKSWKSSLRRSPTARPCLSRTTTGTSTRLTFVRKVAGVSRVVISSFRFGGGCWVWPAAAPQTAGRTERHSRAAGRSMDQFYSFRGRFARRSRTPGRPCRNEIYYGATAVLGQTGSGCITVFGAAPFGRSLLKRIPGVGILEQHGPESELGESSVDHAQTHGVDGLADRFR